MRRASWKPFQNLRSRTALRCGRTAGSVWFNQMGTTSKDATVWMMKNSTNVEIWTQDTFWAHLVLSQTRSLEWMRKRYSNPDSHAFDVKTYLAGLLRENRLQKNWIMASKSVTVLLKKNEKRKNILKKFYGPSRKKWKIVTCPQKALRCFEKSEKLKNFLKKR